MIQGFPGVKGGVYGDGKYRILLVEVLARTKAALRRIMHYDNVHPEEPDTLTAGDLIMNLTDYRVTKRGEAVELTAKEFEILRLLMQNPQKVYSGRGVLYDVFFSD